MLEIADSQRGGSDQKARHKLSTKEIVDKKGTQFGGSVTNVATRKGKSFIIEGEVPVPSTCKGRVLTDWPYNRGSTPPAFHPLPLYTPVDTRDENGKMKEADGRVFGRNYFSNHSRSMVTAGGFLNGLPRAGDGYRPYRVCGKGVIEAVEAEKRAKQLEALEDAAGDDPFVLANLDILRKTKVKMVPIEDQIARRVVSLHGGGEWGNPLEFLPIQLTKAPDLLELDLSSNKLRRIPDAICNMVNLEWFNLDSNCLEVLPQGMGQLKSLVWLSACNNLVDRIPASFAKLQVIQMADFSNNTIELLTEHTTSVSSLTTLSFFGNKLNSQMPAYPGAEPHEVLKMASLHKLVSLTNINLELNKLTHVPFGLSALENLKFLRLGRNQIVSRGAGSTSYPELDAADAMRQLQHLAPNLLFLELHHNRVDWIPEEICVLSRLTHLDFSSNQICSIPDEVTQLVVLRTFKMDRNPLHSIPTSMASMSWLREFTSKDNVIGRVGGLTEKVPGGTVGKWRRQHGPLDGKIFQQLGKFLQLDPMVLSHYEKAQCVTAFDAHAGMNGAIVQKPSHFTSPVLKPPGTAGSGSASRRSSRHGSRHGARRAMETTFEVGEHDDASTEAQGAKGRLELQEARARYTLRRNERFGGQAPRSPGALSMSSPDPAAVPFHDTTRSPQKNTYGSPDRRGITGFAANLSSDRLSPSDPITRKGTRSREASRPHVRTYLFEHQFANSMYVLEDGWKEDMAVKKSGMVGARGQHVRTGSSVSSASFGSKDKPQSNSRIGTSVSHGSSVGAAAKPKYEQIQEQQEQEAEELLRFNAQMGITETQPPPSEYSFEYYRNTATTPYIPIERLQGL